jgi:hypothetical protein
VFQVDFQAGIAISPAFWTAREALHLRKWKITLGITL